MITCLVALLGAAGADAAAPAAAENRYTATVLVANDERYRPLIMIDPLLRDGWGIAIRPPGAGGHFWISNFGSGTTTTYVGDVHGPDGVFKPLFQDELKKVDIGIGKGRRLGRLNAETAKPTGQVYNHSATDFVVSGEGISGASKFIFVTGEGTISGWTERKETDGTMNRQATSVVMVDTSDKFDNDVLRYSGCAVTDYLKENKLFVTNWADNRIEAYDHEWKRIDLHKNAYRLPQDLVNEGYLPYNIQFMRTGPNNEGRLWAAYAIVDDPWEETPSFGVVAEYDLNGKFLRRLLPHKPASLGSFTELRAPWGFAVAPKNFGPLSEKFLVANFGDGTIAGFDLKDGSFVDFLRDDQGNPIKVEGVWGITFGNGVALGDADALYFAAGPNSENDGTFGSIRLSSRVKPAITVEPQDQAMNSGGGPATFSVEARCPSYLAYQWQVERSAGEWAALVDGAGRSDGMVSGATISGAKTATLRVAGAASGMRVRCELSNGGGVIHSRAATLIANATSPAATGAIGSTK